MSTHLPEAVVYTIATILRTQECPVYDPERDIASMNTAFGSTILIDDERRHPVKEYTRDSLRAVHCHHCVGEWSFDAKGVRTRGRRKGLLNGEDVHRLVLGAHGGDSSTWLACHVSRQLLPLKTLEFPRWYMQLWLPIPHAQEVDVRLIRSLWIALERHVFNDGGICAPSDDVVAFVNEQRSGVKGEIYPWAESIELIRICAAAADIPSASDSERRKFAVNSTDGNLSRALAECGDDAFPPGSVSRALRLSQLSQHWTASVMLRECVSFVTRNSTEGENFDDRLFASRTEAAREMSMEHGVDVGESTDADAIFEVIDLHLRKREVVGPFEALGMSVKFSSTDDYSKDNINEIEDSVSGFSSREIGLRHGCQVWEDYGPRRYNNSRCVETFDAEELREIFDRRLEIRDALDERGIEIRADSMTCREYILYGTYSGPSFEMCAEVDDEDPIECVVELMDEMRFLYKTRTYPQYREALSSSDMDREEASEYAKLAFLHTYVVVDGRPESELPVRLRTLFRGSEAGCLEEAYEEATEAMTELADRRYHMYCIDDDDSSEEDD